jgi:tetratricopeptide (TPR) repeat protein
MNEAPGGRAPEEQPEGPPEGPPVSATRPGEQPEVQPEAQPVAAARPHRGGALRGRTRAALAASAPEEATRPTEATRSTEAARPTGRPPRAADKAVGSTSADDRAIGLRLARVHLRMGSLLLARAELEAYAGRDVLDEDALLDLAEVRWRTGDLPGAGEAADALLARGRDDVLALVIAAEALAALGRPTPARQLAGRALVAAGGPLEPLFAGMPRSVIWPADPAGVDARPVVGADEPVASPGTRLRPGTRRPRAGMSVATAEEDAGPASAAAAEAFAGGRAALGGWDPAPAALRLGVALRLEPGFAQAVLEAIGDRSVEPTLALVAGDALRLLGRESEALAAFDRARGHADGRGHDEDPDVARDRGAAPRSGPGA